MSPVVLSLPNARFVSKLLIYSFFVIANVCDDGVHMDYKVKQINLTLVMGRRMLTAARSHNHTHAPPHCIVKAQEHVNTRGINLSGYPEHTHIYLYSVKSIN